jgi:hypothetical protein
MRCFIIGTVLLIDARKNLQVAPFHFHTKARASVPQENPI